MVNPKIHTEDWNILVILDACRYDYFQQMNPFEGQLTKIETGESCTNDWLRKNFPEKYPYTYVSGNSFCAQNVETVGFLGGKHFEKVIDVWKFGWNPKYNTVLPGVITASAIPYLSEEKVIIHYMQPHQPGIGKTRDKLLGWNPTPPHIAVSVERYRKVPIELYKQAYEENLEIVLKEVRELFNHISCLTDEERKIVITSDHGEMLGEKRMRAHPCGTITPILCDVPWFEVEWQW